MDVRFSPCSDRPGGDMDQSEALSILKSSDEKFAAVLEAATQTRRRHFGDKVRLCSILNAKSGLCSEDCAFCAQSLRNSAKAESYPLLPGGEIEAAYKDASSLPVERFSVVTSGRKASPGEVDTLCDVIEANANGKLAWCASLGQLEGSELQKLKASGLKRFHHNLETAPSYFPRICTTHTYNERLETLKAAKDAGLEVCAGGIMGMGESPEQRVELAFCLRELEVDCIPLNFLIPIPATRAASFAQPLSAGEILRTIAMFRLVCPSQEIKVCAGREHHLADKEGMIFAAGATGIMVGGYLTVKGREVAEDLKMVREAGMTYE